MPIIVIESPTEQQTIEIFSGVASSIGIVTSGSGESVFKEQNGSVVTLKSLVAGNGISLTSDADEITIAATAISLTADRALVTDGGGLIGVSNVTSTELSYVSGVTSSIQTQINSKQNTIVGAASSVVSLNLVANRLLVSDGSGKIAAGTIPPSSLTYISDLTYYAQAQLDGKLSLTGGTLVGNLTSRNITIPAPYSLIIGSGADMTISTSGIISASKSISFTNGAISTTNGWIGSLNGGLSFDNGTTKIRCKKYSIGSWNMPFSATKTIAHLLPDIDKIISVDVLIIDDNNTSRRSITYSEQLDEVSGGWIIAEHTINLIRYVGGIFNTTNFDDSSVNRGYVTIWYEV